MDDFDDPSKDDHFKYVLDWQGVRHYQIQTNKQLMVLMFDLNKFVPYGSKFSILESTVLIFNGKGEPFAIIHN